MFRTREKRLGKGVLYTPGAAVPARPRMLHDRRLPHLSGIAPVSPDCIPARGVKLTRHHQGFPFSRPASSLPLACGPRSGREPSGFPTGFAPGRYRPRTPWRGQVRALTRKHVTSTNWPPTTCSLLTCDLTSQALRMPPSPRISGHLAPLGRPPARCPHKRVLF